MTIFNWADYIILGVIAFSVLISMVRGFVREALSLVTWILAVWASVTFGKWMATFLSAYIKSASLQLLAGYGTLFIVTLILGSIGNYLISEVVDKTGLSGTDRVLGAFFGAARGVLLVSVLLMLVHLTPAIAQPWWKEAVLIPRFEPLEVWIHDMLPKSVTSHFVLNPAQL